MPATVVSTSSGSGFGTITAPRPADVAAGDVLFAVHSTTADYAGVSAPSGWTLTASIPDAFFGLLWTRVWRRTVAASEPASYAFPQPSGAAGTVMVTAVADADLSKQIRIAILQNAEETSVVTTPSVTPAAAEHLEIRFAVSRTSSATVTLSAPSGYAMRGQVKLASRATSAVASRLINSSSASGSKTFAISGDNSGVSHGVTISIASGSSEPEVPPTPPFTPGQGSGKYQYVFRRLLDRAYLGHLDLSGVSFEKRVSSAGTFGGQVPITNTDIGDQIDAIIPRDRATLNRGPGVISVEVLREGQYWGEYWITGYTLRKDRRKGPVLSLRGSTVDAYFQHVLLRETLTFTNQDQIDIARSLLESMQAQDHADLNLVLQPGTSGQLRDRTYKPADGATYGQRLTELGEVINGFESTVNTVAGPSGLERQWAWGAPTLGDENAEHVFGSGYHGGDVLDWGYEVDGLKGGTFWQARGDTPQSDASTEAVPLLSAVYEATAHTAAGWPRIDRLVDRPGVVVQQTLEDYAAGWAERKSGAVTVFSVTVAIGEQPSFTPNNLGDTARFVMSDEWHKRTGMGAGVNARHRIIGCRVVPIGRDHGKDEMELIVESAEVT
ncbi:hypothetical protein [Nonomuraea indica]|uniref:hypothetical protein n=1 Tax=Nonomuraea indica TaxID=1581193 RepID=UPI000C7DA90C|nr:hypothetical protein [Nonomuraea indica]